MNVAIYCRVSTTQQAEHGYSLGTQIELCRKKAEELGADSVKEYIDDGYSGAYMERPALDSLRDALASGMHDTVIIYDTDRLARDMMVLLVITEEIEKHAKLVFVNSEYSQSPESQLFYKIKGSFAEYERIRILDRMNRGRRGKLKKGLPIKEYKILGYDFTGGHYVVNEKEAEIVRLIYKLYLEGNGGINKIPDILFNMGIVGLNGRKYHRGTIYHILTHSHYTGHYYSYRTWHKKTGVRSVKVLKREESEWIPMECPQIIPQETFDAVQEKMARNRVQKVRTGKIESLFQGLLYCKLCGKKMRLSRFGNDGYYICGSNREAPGTCENRICKVTIVDTVVWSAICDLCRSESALKKHLKADAPKKKDSAALIKKELEKISTQRTAIMQWFSNNLISVSECTEKLEQLKKREQTLTAQLQSENQEHRTDASDIVKKVKACDVDFAGKRRIVTTIIKKVSIVRTGDKHGRNYDLDFDIEFQ